MHDLWISSSYNLYETSGTHPRGGNREQTNLNLNEGFLGSALEKHLSCSVHVCKIVHFWTSTDPACRYWRQLVSTAVFSAPGQLHSVKKRLGLVVTPFHSSHCFSWCFFLSVSVDAYSPDYKKHLNAYIVLTHAPIGFVVTCAQEDKNSQKFYLKTISKKKWIQHTREKKTFVYYNWTSHLK